MILNCQRKGRGGGQGLGAHPLNPAPASAPTEALYFVTALVPSETACLASSPGKMRRTAVWISREVIVCRLLYRAKRTASLAICSKISATKEFMMAIA